MNAHENSNHSTIDYPLEAAIQVSRFGESYGIAITIYQRCRAVARDFHLLSPNQITSEPRAWYLGYVRAQALADEYAPDAPLFVREAEEMRRTAA